MAYKKISLFLIAVLAVLLIFCMPFYNKWLQNKFGDEGSRMLYEAGNLSVDDRLEARFGNTYIIQKAAANMLDKVHAQNALILLPPRGYVASMKLKSGSFEVPEPAVFYYFTGYKAVTKNNPLVSQANWALLIEKRRMVLKRINSTHFLDSLLTLYKPYN